jgi:biotin carboxyl carrier protein
MSFDIAVKKANGRTAVTLDGKPVSVDLAKADGGKTVSLVIDGRSHEAIVEKNAQGWIVTIDGRRTRVDLSRRTAAGFRASSRKASGEIMVAAPMPGLVVAVNVAAGDAVDAGNGLVILEAMKMQNELRSPRAAQVKKVLVSQGDKVEQSQPLVILK